MTNDKDWQRKYNEFFYSYTFIPEEVYLQDLINFSVACEQTIKGPRNSVFLIEAIKDDDWGAWEDDFKDQNLDMVITLSNSVVFPPRHDATIIFSPNREVNRIKICYTYHFHHISTITINSDDDIITKLFAYIKSIFLINICKYHIEEKTDSLKSLPVFGDLLSKMYPFIFMGNDALMNFESMSTTLMEEFEAWLEINLDTNEKSILIASYDEWHGK